ncbi:MAG: hypothetical protein GMKNLPBB_03010 [Myxococcota bacterium]|nr:hypothetical protein [Myxococcota bacterium]
MARAQGLFRLRAHSGGVALEASGDTGVVAFPNGAMSVRSRFPLRMLQCLVFDGAGEAVLAEGPEPRSLADVVAGPLLMEARRWTGSSQPKSSTPAHGVRVIPPAAARVLRYAAWLLSAFPLNASCLRMLNSVERSLESAPLVAWDESEVLGVQQWNDSPLLAAALRALARHVIVDHIPGGQRIASLAMPEWEMFASALSDVLCAQEEGRPLFLRPGRMPPPHPLEQVRAPLMLNAGDAPIPVLFHDRMGRESLADVISRLSVLLLLEGGDTGLILSGPAEDTDASVIPLGKSARAMVLEFHVPEEACPADLAGFVSAEVRETVHRMVRKKA